MPEKEPFDIDEVFRRLREATAHLPKAAMFELRDRGYGSPFEQLVASLISARTLDETTIPVSLRLFEVARTPEALANLDEGALVKLLRGATFPEPKARDLKRLAQGIVESDRTIKCARRLRAGSAPRRSGRCNPAGCDG